MGSPCIDICQYDDDTGWCFGCGMRKKDKKAWKKDRDRRPDILAALPGRLASLVTAGYRVGEEAKRKKKKD